MSHKGPMAVAAASGRLLTSIIQRRIQRRAQALVFSTETGRPGQPLRRGPDGSVSPVDALWPISDLIQRRKPGIGGVLHTARRPTDSLLRVELPFGSDPVFRAAFVNFRGHLRFGKVLEELDFFAGEKYWP